MDKYEHIYRSIASDLIAAKIITRRESSVIARYGHRKQQYWRRHIIDLCEYATDKMNLSATQDQHLLALCVAGIRIAKSETTPHDA